jgi:succinate dehydrogenase / fumarate reductase, cytochrome b subunit
MASPGARPLSPHLQIWRWGPAMLVSILHRVSGNGLAVAGLAVLVWWLAALAGGEATYQSFASWIWPDLSANKWGSLGEVALSLLNYALRLVPIGISWAFFNHLASGLRHFVLDAGAGFELGNNNLWSILTPVIGLVLTAAFWVALLLR